MTPAEIAIAVKLVIAHARQRPGRLLLTSISTMAAACVVVWVVSGYDSLVGQFGAMGEEYVGRYAVLLIPTRGENADLAGDMPGGLGRFGRGGLQLPRTFLETLRHDPAVLRVDPIYETTLKVGPEEESRALQGGRTPAAKTGPPAKPASGPTIMGGMAQLKAQGRAPTVVGTDSPEPLHTLLSGAWFDPNDSLAPNGAITREAAEFLGVRPGDEVIVTGPGQKESRIRIVAVVEQPRRLPGPRFMVGLPPTRAAALPGGPAIHALYVPTALAERLTGSQARASYAGVVLRPGVRVDDLLERWGEQLRSASPPVEARTPQKVDAEVAGSTTFDTVRSQAFSATGISLLAALFIIFTTVSMGVDERARQLAMLRAVAFTKTQIAAMVTVESVLLGLIGWGGGLLAGWGLLKLVGRLHPETLTEGAELGGWCVILSGCCALGGSLAAAILPAWRATRVSPLEAMVPHRPGSCGRLPWLLAVGGLLLSAVNPLLVFYVPMPDAARYAASAAVGCTSLAVGFVLLAPPAVLLTERIFGSVLARLLWLHPRLLATQLSANLWRTVGTTVAMSVGLGLFVAMQTWGYSMLAPFTPGDWAPDLVVSLGPAGVPDSALEAARHVRGVVPERFLPLAVKQVKFADDPTGARVRASATRQDNCVMIGFDPDLALGGDRPLFDFAFTAGTRTDAIARLKQGRCCLVPDHFTRESGLGVGQKFRVLPPNHPDQPVEYEIAGVVSMPGWHWMTKGFRRGRAAGLMFASFENVRADFAPGGTTAFWGSMDGTATQEQIKAAIQSIADRSAPAEPGRGLRREPSAPDGRRMGVSVNLQSVEGVRTEIRGRADKIIWALGELPLITLLVTSLGVMNTVLSSIRARRWDLGVLRALGVTRFGLFRLILAESLLIGVVVCLLSLGFGTIAGYCGTGVTRYINIRGGQLTPLVIPWSRLTVGFALTLGLCLLAALWPALRTGRTEPLRLLQAGRAPT